MPAPLFAVEARDPGTAARAGRIRTAHGDIPTPAFAPVGTQAAVKALSPRDLESLGVSVVMSNAYHLSLRPEVETVQALGGLHALAGWKGPMMTDSGGFQVFSLDDRASVDDEGVSFRSHLDGSHRRFTPESVVALQQGLGADLAMPLDVCTPYPASRELAERDLGRTMAWAQRARAAHGGHPQRLYGIVQGSIYPDLRRASARGLVQIGFDAYAIGGLSVGETKAEMWPAVAAAVKELPDAAPRHLLGVGHPEDLIEGIAAGMDSFDCVMPTRVARTAAALTISGRINLRNAEHRLDTRPIEAGCACYACQHFSRGSIRHLIKAREILAAHLLTLHNLHFTLELVRAARQAILDCRFAQFRTDFLARYADGRYLRPMPVAQTSVGFEGTFAEPSGLDQRANKR